MASPHLDAALPHRPPMRFVREVLACADGSARCAVSAGAGDPFVTDGVVAPLALVEFMAQAAAVCASSTAGASPSEGYLTTVRQFEVAARTFAAGTMFEVRARSSARNEVSGVFACEVLLDGTRVASAVLGVYVGAPRA